MWRGLLKACWILVTCRGDQERDLEEMEAVLPELLVGLQNHQAFAQRRSVLRGTHDSPAAGSGFNLAYQVERTQGLAKLLQAGVKGQHLPRAQRR